LKRADLFDDTQCKAVERFIALLDYSDDVWCFRVPRLDDRQPVAPAFERHQYNLHFLPCHFGDSDSLLPLQFAVQGSRSLCKRRTVAFIPFSSLAYLVLCIATSSNAALLCITKANPCDTDKVAPQFVRAGRLARLAISARTADASR
jgi:hypothetical protein